MNHKSIDLGAVAAFIVIGIMTFLIVNAFVIQPAILTCDANTAKVAVHFDNVGLLRAYEGDDIAREALLRSAIEGRLLIADREALYCKDDLAVCDKVFASYAGQPIGLRPEQIVECASLLGRVIEVTDLSGDDVFNQQ